MGLLFWLFLLQLFLIFSGWAGGSLTPTISYSSIFCFNTPCYNNIALTPTMALITRQLQYHNIAIILSIHLSLLFRLHYILVKLRLLLQPLQAHIYYSNTICINPIITTHSYIYLTTPLTQTSLHLPLDPISLCGHSASFHTPTIDSNLHSLLLQPFLPFQFLLFIFLPSLLLFLVRVTPHYSYFDHFSYYLYNYLATHIATPAIANQTIAIPTIVLPTIATPS